MKKFNKIMCLLMAMAMVLGLAACNDGKTPSGTTGSSETTDPAGTTGAPVAEYVDPYAHLENYDEKSAAIYEDILGEFNTAYQAAKDGSNNLSKRFALMAIAEAKLLGSGAMLPMTAKGGNYAISRVAPYTAPNTLWGNDSYRFHNVVVVTEPITVEHRNEMKAKWAEVKGTGTYEEWAKQYLTEKGYTLKDSYSFGYPSDPQSWDVLATNESSDSEAIINTYDGLYEYDCEGTLKPALALSHTVTDNADGTQTWTFTLRQGVKWVDYQGREVGEVTADDFVAGMQHMLDAGGELSYLAYEAAQIVGSLDYYKGDTTDFATVGVKAVDKYTVAYTLAKPSTFFDTMLGYSVFAPMNRAFYESKGGKFGADYDSTAAYGTTPENIAYCGPYLVTNNTAENMIVFSANPSYWNAENINMKTITWKYNDGTDDLKAYNDAMAGTIDGCGLNSAAATKAKADGNFDGLAYVSSCDATTYFAFNNLNRTAIANVNDPTVAVSPKTEEQMALARAAMYNQHFRLALCMAVDRAAFNAQTVGEELKLTSLRNTFTPGNFVSLPEETTVEINGTAKTYPAGTFYGQIMQDQLDADGIKVTVWDPTAEAGVGSSDGFDGWYSAENAAAELALAVEELKAQGIEISAENPVYIDLTYFAGAPSYANRANAYKQSVEASLGGLVKVNLVACQTQDDILYAGYYINNGAEANYDVYDMAGWGPDYGDPQTYLDTILPDYSGAMTKMLGIF